MNTLRSQLYYSPGACSLSVHIALETLKIPYELIKVDLNSEHQSGSKFLQVNRRARVPVLIHGETRIRESVAILQFLNELYPEKKLAPVDVTERAKNNEWLQFGTSSIHPFFGGLWRSARFTSNPSHVKDIQQTCEKAIIQCFIEFDEFLGEKKFLLGDHPYLCDFYYMPLLRWLNCLAQGRTMYQNIPRYFDNLIALPAVKRAMSQENLAIDRSTNYPLEGSTP